jgi:uncharacterized protein YndB with AHSA1/START domain
MASQHSSTNHDDREIVITRVLKAPRSLIWKTWTEPAHIQHWYGPLGFTLTTHAMDVRPGGIWRFTMHGPDGTDYPNNNVFHEVVAPERLVYTASDETLNADPNRMDVIVTFAEIDATTTRLTMHSRFQSPEARDHAVRIYGAIEGGKQTLDRLAKHLTAQQAQTGAERR